METDKLYGLHFQKIACSKEWLKKMMITEKRQINVIRHFRYPELACCISEGAQHLRQLNLNQVTDYTIVRGFYTHHRGHFIGITATSEGPLFFYDKQYFQLSEGKFIIALEHDDKRNTFSFWWDGVEICRLNYQRQLYRYNEGIVDDGIRDFFAWLYLSTGPRKFWRFQKFYTVKSS
ncbi:hypothetical protein [Paenibacillus sp. FSL H8-0537]|uniref:hypothetical protein n=1 Tax=Paenibacillus sp. FSL H8-0537 TaxID=2921399 RepID=UPI0031011BAA